MTSTPDAPKQTRSMVHLRDDGETYTPVGLGSVVASTEKLLAVNRGTTDPDRRDSLAFKRVISPAKMMSEHVRLDSGKLRRNIARLVSRQQSLKALTPAFMDGYVDTLFNGNPLVMPLEEINPMSILEQARRFSHFGPGGIGSPDAITADMQEVNGDQFGFLSPVEGPESERAGVDARAAHGTKLGSDGKLYQRFRRKDGVYVWLSPEDTQDVVVKLPD